MAFGFCLSIAFLSDVFDGIIVRRLQIATPNLRRLDSLADSIFYVGTTYATWHLYPLAISSRLTPLMILGALEIGRYALDILKFKREANYHLWSSKLWGICVFLGFFTILAMHADNVMVSAAIYVGIVADIEGLCISLVLRNWKSDVPTLFHAIAWQRQHQDGDQTGAANNAQ